MLTRKLFTLLLLLAAITSYSQKNFSYSPEKPGAGSVISFTYEPETHGRTDSNDRYCGRYAESFLRMADCSENLK